MLLPEQKAGPVVEMEQERPVAATNQRPVTPPIPFIDPPPPPIEPALDQPFHYQIDPSVKEISVPRPKPSQVPTDEQPAHLTKQATPVAETDRKPKPVASPALIEPMVTRLASPPNSNRPVLPVTEIRPAQPSDLLHQPVSLIEPATIEIRPESSKPGSLPVSSPRRWLNEAPSVTAGQPAWSNVPWGAASDPPPTPTINVRIGRIEVKASIPAKSKPAKSPQTTPVMSLEQYLRRRNGGGDR